MITTKGKGMIAADGIEGAILVLSGMFLRIVKAEHDYGVENIMRTLESRKENPEAYEIWRQQDEDALYTAIIELAKPLPESVRREVAPFCNSKKIRDALLAL